MTSDQFGVAVCHSRRSKKTAVPGLASTGTAPSISCARLIGTVQITSSPLPSRRKNRSGSDATSSSWAPGGAAHQMPRRPSSWWSSTKVTNVFLPCTNHVGEPWESRSVASGRARHAARTRASAASFLSRSARSASANATETAVPATRVVAAAASDPATALLRRTHFQARSHAGAGRAETGRPSSQFPRSSASSFALHPCFHPAIFRDPPAG